jgi:hypothetical protein
VASIEVREAVQYGQEEELRRQLKQGSLGPAQWVVLLMTMAATPEVENHGTVIGALRDELAQTASAAPLLVLIDTGPYAARMQGDPSLEARLAERQNLWAGFVSGYGLRACIVNLPRILAGAPSELEAREQVRAALFSVPKK